MEIKLGDVKISLQSLTTSPGVCIIQIDISDENFTCYLDERDNTLNCQKVLESYETLKAKNWPGYFLIESFTKLKQSDFRYGKLEDNLYEPTKKITGREFLSFLQKEYREKLLQNILK